MRVYLDNCCYNRPYDSQNQLAVRLETEAKLRVQQLMRIGATEYVWSKVLDYELGNSPYTDQAEEIEVWADWPATYVEMDDSVVRRATQIMASGVKRMDALHLASALAAQCDWFLTTDRGILKHVRLVDGIKVANPVDFVMEEQK